MNTGTELVEKVRFWALLSTGLICLGYAILAMIEGRPDPFSSWLPGIAGIMAALTILLTGFWAGSKAASMAVDEGYRADTRRAAGIAFWIALLLYPVFGLALAQGWVGHGVAFAAMGTLTGAAYLLLFCWFDGQGR